MTDRSYPVSRPIVLAAILATLATLTACGANPAVQAGTPARAISTLALRSAFVVAPSTTLSCTGRSFCRENVIAPGNDEAVTDAMEDCARRGAETRQAGCARDAIVASCSLSSEAGSITVFTYAQASGRAQSEAISTMSELCDNFEGSFELVAKREPSPLVTTLLQ